MAAHAYDRIRIISRAGPRRTAGGTLHGFSLPDPLADVAANTILPIRIGNREVVGRSGHSPDLTVRPGVLNCDASGCAVRLRPHVTES